MNDGMQAITSWPVLIIQVVDIALQLRPWSWGHHKPPTSADIANNPSGSDHSNSRKKICQLCFGFVWGTGKVISFPTGLICESQSVCLPWLPELNQWWFVKILRISTSGKISQQKYFQNEWSGRVSFNYVYTKKKLL